MLILLLSARPHTFIQQEVCTHPKPSTTASGHTLVSFSLVSSEIPFITLHPFPTLTKAPPGHCKDLHELLSSASLLSPPRWRLLPAATLTHASSPAFGSLSIAHQQVGPISPHRVDDLTCYLSLHKGSVHAGIPSIPLYTEQTAAHPSRPKWENPLLLTKALYGIPGVQPT